MLTNAGVIILAGVHSVIGSDGPFYFSTEVEIFSGSAGCLSYIFYIDIDLILKDIPETNHFNWHIH